MTTQSIPTPRLPLAAAFPIASLCVAMSMSSCTSPTGSRANEGIPRYTQDIRRRTERPAHKGAHEPTLVRIVQRPGGNAKREYDHERDYIRNRKRAVGISSDGLVGLAFSGGGLRSATFNLGVLQGLNDTKALPKMDYLSTVSGGAYIGSWFVSHYVDTAHQTDALGYKTYTNNLNQLLDSSLPSGSKRNGDAINELRHQSTFVLGPRLSKVPLSLGRWAVRWPLNVLFGIALHWRPMRGEFNVYHPFGLYRSNIRETYCIPALKADGGKRPRATLLQDINPKGSKAPYLIINAAMYNGSWHKSKPGSGKTVITPLFSHPDNHPFEFTKDFTGSNDLGFIPTCQFNKEVLRTTFPEHTNDLLAEKEQNRANLKKERRAETVLVSDRQRLFYLFPMPPSHKFELASAVAVSGAALDAGGVPAAAHLPISFLNLHLRYHATNFAQTLASGPGRVLDVLREVTTDRAFLTRHSNSLHLTDGGHHDNLGITALVRRGVKTILVSDASQDLQYRFGSLKQACDEINEFIPCPHCGRYALKWDPIDELKKNLHPTKLKRSPQQGLVNPIHISAIECNECDYTAKVLYLKLSYLPGYLNEQELDEQTILSYLSGTTFAQLRDARPKAHSKFPHQSTFDLKYSTRQFDAYRGLGRVLGKRLGERFNRFSKSAK